MCVYIGREVLIKLNFAERHPKKVNICEKESGNESYCYEYRNNGSYLTNIFEKLRNGLKLVELWDTLKKA